MKKEELLQKAKPILFNTDMLRAILDGRKTETRRCVKAKSKNACGFYVTTRKSDGAFVGVYDYDENEMMFESPQTQPAYIGDILYARETWSDHYVPDEEGKPKLEYCYKTDGTDIKGECLPGENNRWYPSIHMPKEAARIFLKVTDVRVERLQEITEEHAIAEGGIDNRAFIHSTDNEYDSIHTAKEHFEQIWNSTIKKTDIDTHGWDANPWVWVIEFERIEAEE